MMKLICNLSMLSPQPTGLGVYSENCLAGLAKRFNLDLIAGAGFLPPGNVLLKAPGAIALEKGRLASIRRYLWTRALRFDPDNLVYSPTHHGLPKQPDQIITVHDTIHLVSGQYWHIHFFFRFILPHLLKKCRAVFTVSGAAKQEIAHAYGYPLERIFVVPNGVDTAVFRSDPSARPADPFLLMVGGRHPHKNVLETLDMAQYWKQDYRLVIVSCNDGAYRQKLEGRVRDLGLTEQVEFKGYLSDNELLRHYQGASALVYPSLMEGFGIPPLEALACGAQVIASDIPVLREVLGEAASFIRLGDHQSWAEAFKSLTDPSSVDTRQIAARKVLSKFTWCNAVDEFERALLSVEPRIEEIRR
jgi:glycosyltransferase involved in cell wall biosynthesis